MRGSESRSRHDGNFAPRRVVAREWPGRTQNQYLYQSFRLTYHAGAATDAYLDFDAGVRASRIRESVSTVSYYGQPVEISSVVSLPMEGFDSCGVSSLRLRWSCLLLRGRLNVVIARVNVRPFVTALHRDCPNIAGRNPVLDAFRLCSRTVDRNGAYCRRAIFEDGGCGSLIGKTNRGEGNRRLDDHRCVVDELEGKRTVENLLLLGQICLFLYARRRGLYRVSWQHVEHSDCGPKNGMRSSSLRLEWILSFLDKPEGT